MPTKLRRVARPLTRLCAAGALVFLSTSAGSQALVGQVEAPPHSQPGAHADEVLGITVRSSAASPGLASAFSAPDDPAAQVPIPAPTATVEPTAAVEPTATVTPTATVEPTATVTPTATAAPTASPTATAAPTATVAPVVVPTAASLVAPTAAPTEAPVVKAATSPAPAGYVQRGQAAFSRVGYPLGSLGYTISFEPASAAYRGLTNTQSHHISVYIRDSMSDFDIAYVIAHEIGHAVDHIRNDGADRARWRLARGMAPDTSWWPLSGRNDLATPAGDFAECFASWAVGSASHSSWGGCGAANALMGELASS